MISSVFDKTNPINYLLALLFFSIHYWFWFWTGDDQLFSGHELLVFIGKLSLVTLGMFLVEFTVKKNQISAKNTYAIVLFMVLFGVFAPDLYQSDTLLTLFFLLLAFRRILSIRSLVSIKLKVFDASFWILIASYFNPNALYFFLILALAIYFYQFEKLKNWLVILPAIGAYILLVFAYKGIDKAQTFFDQHYQFQMNFSDLSLSKNHLVVLGFVFLGILASIVTYRGLSRSLMGKLISIRLVLFSFLIASFIALIGASNQQQTIFLLFPISVLYTNALEGIKKRWTRDLILLGLISLPFVISVF
jgi:hypothetical protein